MKCFFIILMALLPITSFAYFKNHIVSTPRYFPSNSNVVNFTDTAEVASIPSIDIVIDFPAIELVDDFDLAEPNNFSTMSDIWLFDTFYNLHVANASTDSENAYPLRESVNGNPISSALKQKDWCFAALEGSVAINDNGVVTTYNYSKSVDSNFNVDCTPWFPNNLSIARALGKSRFYKTDSTFGDGVQNYQLVPFRTIAVDPTVIPYGTVIYIPSARGTFIILPDGKEIKHDGYFFAGDTGGAIKKQHIDVFVGLYQKSPFTFEYNGDLADAGNGKLRKTFSAQVITDAAVVQRLRAMHLKN